jgi:hypothetical protein
MVCLLKNYFHWHTWVNIWFRLINIFMFKQSYFFGNVYAIVLRIPYTQAIRFLLKGHRFSGCWSKYEPSPNNWYEGAARPKIFFSKKNLYRWWADKIHFDGIMKQAYLDDLLNIRGFKNGTANRFPVTKKTGRTNCHNQRYDSMLSTTHSKTAWQWT